MPALGIINERFVSFINTALSNAAGVKILLNEKQVDIPGASGEVVYIELPQIKK